MIIDNAIKTFFEKYDREAIQSIENISKEYGLNINGNTIKTFNLGESFNIFNQYMDGYANYKIENVNNLEASKQETIKESVQKFVDTQIFKESETKYSDLPTFVMEYVNGINSLQEMVDNTKRLMTDSEVKAEDIGDINEFTDMFINKLHEHFNPVMESILWASGYNGKQKLIKGNTSKPTAPVFL